MSSATVTEIAQHNPGTLKLRVHADRSPDFLRELDVKGYVVVPDVIPQERAQQYVDDANDWLKGFGLGFDINDKSTW